MIVVFFLSSFCFAETIVLKSGQTREGKIIERTDDYVKIDYHGASVAYFFDEIESIDGKAVTPDLATENKSGHTEADSPPAPEITGESASVERAKEEIENVLHAFFEYECGYDHNIKEASKPAYEEPYFSTEVDNARKLIDWNGFELGPEYVFQRLYKMAFEDKVKLSLERNTLVGLFAGAEVAFEKAGLPQDVEDYKITEININDNINDATVVYENSVRKGKFKVHKKGGRWLIRFIGFRI